MSLLSQQSQVNADTAFFAPASGGGGGGGGGPNPVVSTLTLAAGLPDGTFTSGVINYQNRLTFNNGNTVIAAEGQNMVLDSPAPLTTGLTLFTPAADVAIALGVNNIGGYIEIENQGTSLPAPLDLTQPSGVFISSLTVSSINGAVPGAGATGPTGALGPTGDQGLQGIPGTAVGTGATGPAGDPGGPPGPVGATGPTGPQGNLGPSGPQGIPGSASVTGATGPQGLVGPTGLQGAAGAASSTGATGALGPTGAVGTPGTVGATGAPGAPGATGAPGAAGAPGAVGPTGPSLGVQSGYRQDVPYKSTILFSPAFTTDNICVLLTATNRNVTSGANPNISLAATDFGINGVSSIGFAADTREDGQGYAGSFYFTAFPL